MSILIIATDRDMEPYRKALLDLDPKLEVEIWPDVKSLDRVNFVLAWNQPEGLLGKFPNLKVVSSRGAGVEHLVEDPAIPDGVIITRLVTPLLQTQVAEYVEMACYNFLRRTDDYFIQKQNNIWHQLPHFLKGELSTGVMGLGEIGSFVAQQLANNEWRVNGWSQSSKDLAGIRTFAGPEREKPFLNETNILICLLPLTAETEDILNLALFRELKKPAFLINVGRGGHLIEEDLIYALDAGILSRATLDVFRTEPLPESHPFWNHLFIHLTPHVASVTQATDAAGLLLENYKRMASGMPLLQTVDRVKGY